MKKAIIEQANSIIKVAEQVKCGMIDVRSLPIADVLSITRTVYKVVGHNCDTDVMLYEKLLLKGLSNSDSEQIADILLLIASHFIVLADDNEHIKHLQNNGYMIQSKLGHARNNEKLFGACVNDSLKEPGLFEGKGVIYSAITGGYDNIKEPEYIVPGMDYVLFTDNPNLKSDVWQIRLIDNAEGLDNTRVARRIKIMGHEYLPEYDFSIWVDGKLAVTGDLKEFISQYKRKQPILCFPHYVNDCIYQEAYACKNLKKDAESIIDKQMELYRNEGYPEHNGLIESGVLVRQLHDERVKKVMETWWEQIVNHSRRDQLSFNYACWKNDFLYDTTDLFLYGNKYVRLYNHN